MKKKQFLKTTLLALVLTLGGASTAWADDVAKDAASISDINNAINALTSSDGALTITLTADISGTIGKYPTVAQGAHSITFKGDTKSRVFAGHITPPSQTDYATGCSLIFEDLVIKADDNNFTSWFQRVKADIEEFSFKNCEITDDGSHYFKINDGDNTYKINKLSFDNCKIYDTKTTDKHDIVNLTHNVKTISVTNCLLYNSNAKCFFRAGGATGWTEAVTVVFKNNTIYKWGSADRDALFNGNSKYANVNNQATFSDNIAWDIFGTYDSDSQFFTQTAFSKVGDSNAGTVTFTNNYVYNFGDNTKVSVTDGNWLNWGNTYTVTSAASNTKETNAENIPFISTDASNANFLRIEMNNKAVFATSSSVNSPVGAPSTWQYTWNSGAAKAGTLILPYEANIPEGVSAYTLTYTSGSSASATEITNGILPANNPVLLNAETASTPYVFTSTGVVPDAAPADLVEGAMHGTYSSATLTSASNAYVLQNGGDGLGFYKVGATDITVPAYRAYLVAQGEAHVLTIDFGNGDVTSIREIANSQKPLANSQYYDLQGRKVAQPTKGLYIVNGKKLIIK